MIVHVRIQCNVHALPAVSPYGVVEWHRRQPEHVEDEPMWVWLVGHLRRHQLRHVTKVTRVAGGGAEGGVVRRQPLGTEQPQCSVWRLHGSHEEQVGGHHHASHQTTVLWRIVDVGTCIIVLVAKYY